VRALASVVVPVRMMIRFGDRVWNRRSTDDSDRCIVAGDGLSDRDVIS
jgi:hypothetical protein